MINTIAWFLATVLVIATVLLHYEVIMVVSDRVIPWAQKCARSRRVMAYAIAGLLLGHISEIWLFALATKGLLALPIMGATEGISGNDFSSLLYLSSVNYTSLGDNSIRLVGPVRAIAAGESLVGMMMIAWSASFAYLKMKMIWERRSVRRNG